MNICKKVAKSVNLFTLENTTQFQNFPLVLSQQKNQNISHKNHWVHMNIIKIMNLNSIFFVSKLCAHKARWKHCKFLLSLSTHIDGFGHTWCVSSELVYTPCVSVKPQNLSLTWVYKCKSFLNSIRYVTLLNKFEWTKVWNCNVWTQCPNMVTFMFFSSSFDELKGIKNKFVTIIKKSVLEMWNFTQKNWLVLIGEILNTHQYLKRAYTQFFSLILICWKPNPFIG